jgi:hypothetical protein
LALPPQDNQAFFREVDDNLRQDRMVTAARRFGPLVGAGVVLLLVALAGVLLWRNHQAKALGQASEVLNPALAPIERGAPPPDQAALVKLAADGNGAYQAAARFAIAATLQQKGDVAGAVSAYNGIADDAKVAQPERDIARLRAATLQFDTLKPEQLIERLKPLAVPGNAFFPSAAELTALAWTKLGRKDKAGPLFAAIVRDPATPASMRGRAEGMATSLGQQIAAAQPGVTTTSVTSAGAPPAP